MNRQEENSTYKTIRECGGIVHGDGNIFFTNRQQFERAASLVCGVATVAVSQAKQPAQQTDLIAAIMALPMTPQADATAYERFWYAKGHRDARHAAAARVASQQPAPRDRAN